MKQSRYRWFVVVIFFFFMLLHQSDKLLIGPLTTRIMDAFKINEAQMGFVFTGALIDPPGSPSLQAHRLSG